VAVLALASATTCGSSWAMAAGAKAATATASIATNNTIFLKTLTSS
jgi:hypothetical protein